MKILKKQESWVEGYKRFQSFCGHWPYLCDSYELIGIHSRFKNDFLWCWCTRISRTRGYGSGPFQWCDVHCQVQDGGDSLWLKLPFKLFQSVEEMFKCWEEEAKGCSKITVLKFLIWRVQRLIWHGKMEGSYGLDERWVSLLSNPMAMKKKVE